MKRAVDFIPTPGLRRFVDSPLQSLEVSYLLHATEDPEKVRSAVARIIHTDALPETQDMVGHFGNGITMVTFHLNGDDATEAFRALASRLPRELRSELIGGMDLYLDEHSSFFVRLDKQSLVGGKLALGTKDAVRIKAKPRGYVMKGRAKDFFAGLLAK